MSFVKNIMEGGDISSEAAEALLVLIPKGLHPMSMKEFMPSSLCKTVYKLISKIVVGRLKDALKVLISPFQASFVPGCPSIDNVVVCKEIVHSMKHTKAKKGSFVIKLDMEKAYDRLEWTFIESTLIDAGIPTSLVTVIMKMISSGSCRLLWNGEVTDSIRSSRGLRQGCPVSPYFFVLCMEKLGQWIQSKAMEGRLRGVKTSKSGPTLNYLFFADDLLLFSEASEDQIQCLKEGLERFCACSGQKINFNKSYIFFSSNMREAEASRLCSLMGIPRAMNLGKYLANISSLKGGIEGDMKSFC